MSTEQWLIVNGVFFCPFSVALQLSPEGDTPGGFHLIELHDMGSLVHINIQNGAGAKHGVLHTLANWEDDGVVIFWEVPLAAFDIPFGLSN